MSKQEKWWLKNPKLWKEWVQLCKEIGYPVDEEPNMWTPADLRPFLAALHADIKRVKK